nr:hypothetical protein [Tanacetum cinerariifolium]
MLSDNAQFAVTYTSISSDSDGPSWGIPLMNASEFLEIDPYEEVPQQGQDPSKEHEPEDDDEDPEEDPNKEHKPEDEDTREPSKDSDETEPFEEDETALTSPPPRHCGARISFAVNYTSISSDSDGPSWGIPHMNASEFLEIDPYEEVAQQGHVHLLSPAYVPDLVELDEHVPIHVSEPEHPNKKYEPEDDDEDPEEDPNKEHKPEDKDTREPSKDSNETEPFEEDETAFTSPPPRHCGARISVRP